MEGELRTDLELLLDLFNAAPLVRDRATGHCVVFSRKQVAHWTGLALQTISDYCGGKYNIPISFWQRILEHCHDSRIVALLLGDASSWELTMDCNPQPHTGADFFRSAVEQTGAHHEKQTYIAEMLADNRIDELDRQTILDYNDAYAHHRHLDAQLHRSINLAHERSRAAKGATP